MSIFRAKRSKDMETHKEVVQSMIDEYDDLCKKICKASGMDLDDMLAELDETSGAILGACIQSSQRILGLAIKQAEIMDSTAARIEELERINTDILANTALLLERR